MEDQRPTKEEVLKYAERMTKFFISRKAKFLPKEQQEEIQQIAMIVMLEKYDEIRAEGWKSLTYQKCRGVVLDYIKQGTGFEDDSDNHRVDLANSDGDDISIDQVMGAEGIFTDSLLDKINIRWDLVARLASGDIQLHAFAKQLLGIQLRIIGPVLNVEIARADQLVKEFIDRFDNPEYADDTTDKGMWFRQCCYALGISEIMGWPNEPAKYSDLNSGIGFGLKPVDLYSEEHHQAYKEKNSQMGFDLDG